MVKECEVGGRLDETVAVAWLKTAWQLPARAHSRIV